MLSVTHELGPDIQGNRRQVVSHRYGAAGARPKIYLQAGLHAGEIPGMLALRHLMPLLAGFETAGRIAGEIVVVPVANPIGLSQGVLHDNLGRFELHTAQNFNRHYPDLGALAMERLDGRLTADAEENKAVIRREMAAALAEVAPKTELDEQRRLLLGMALDADMVLDLHCDLEALYHLYTTDTGREWGIELARYVGAAASLISNESGGNAFDESCSTQWDRFRARYGERFPIPAGCQAATLELRGLADVDDRTAAEDAANLADWLVAVGAVAGTVPPPKFDAGEIVPLAGVDDIVAPAGGVLSFRRELGDRVAPGDVIADLINPESGERLELRTRNEGLLYARECRRYVRRGTSIAQVTGMTPIRTGSLLAAR
jgi:predicted deacylase